jgi:tetratricopeptide (TPR) repeat protein
MQNQIGIRDALPVLLGTLTSLIIQLIPSVFPVKHLTSLLFGAGVLIFLIVIGWLVYQSANRTKPVSRLMFAAPALSLGVLGLYGYGLFVWHDHESPHETLILIANFEDASEHSTYDAGGAIKAAIEEALPQYGLADRVRIVRIEETFTRDQLEAVKALGKEYNATLFLWGHYDDAGMYPRFTILKEERITVRPEKPEDQYVNLAAPPDDFAFYVNVKLPNQMLYFTQFTLGQIFYREEAYDEALRLLAGALESAAQLEPEKIRGSLAAIHFWVGYIHQVVHQNNEQAIADYDQAIALDPKYAAAYNNRGAAYYAQGEYKLAIADFSKAIELAPDDPAAYNNRGLIYPDQGEYELAIADFNKAIALDPKDSKTYSNRGLTYADQGKYDLAIADHNKAIALDPEDPVAYYNRGVAYYAQGKYELAIADYTKAIKLSPNLTQAYNNRGNVYDDQGKYDLAIADYTKAIALDPSKISAYYNRGYTYYIGLEEYELAIADFSKAIELDPDLAVAYCNRGIAYAAQGKYDLAIADYTKCLELAPPNAPYRELVEERLAELRGE